MDIDHNREIDGEMVSTIASCGLLLHSLLAGFARKVGGAAREDPRRVAHSLKVGLALALVSAVYFVTPLFNGLGVSAIWAVLTVVVVMEFTVGATLSKGLNRAMATLVAGCIAVGAHQLAELAERCSDQGEPVMLTVLVFFVASAATFLRFIPEIKAKYDYGVTIFILTFGLVAVSSYRVEELIQLAHQRFYTIVVGVFICLCTTVFLFPVWAGEDVHKLASSNLDKLAQFIEVHLCQMGASSWPVQISTPMEPIPEVGNSLPPMCIFHGSSCFICHHNHKNPVPCSSQPRVILQGSKDMS
uniref:ALMT1-M39.2 variant n=1 Tax=Secale cereale TaxID=4550 RepID=B2XSB6_SECCE|nr:ALMT1-M39.2 variant [Secale cereale]